MEYYVLNVLLCVCADLFAVAAIATSWPLPVRAFTMSTCVAIFVNAAIALNDLRRRKP